MGRADWCGRRCSLGFGAVGRVVLEGRRGSRGGGEGGWGQVKGKGKDFEEIWIEKIKEYMVGEKIGGMDWLIIHERVGIHGIGACLLMLC